MTMVLRNTTACIKVAASVTNGTCCRDADIGIPKWEGVLIYLVIAVTSCLIAKVFNSIRGVIYRGENTLDTFFDAGGRVTAGLTATTIVSKWTWENTILYSSNQASEYGVSGPLWYAAGGTVQILIFAIVAVQLKIRAPGAKTILQVIRARFGTTTHKVFCTFALMTNMFTMITLLLGGSTALSHIVNGMSVDLAIVLSIITVGSYAFIGGLGATFYVSYFNTAVICVGMLIFLITVYSDHTLGNPLGSIDAVYKYVSCKKAPPGNRDDSYFTVSSQKGLNFGVTTIFASFGVMFADQSYWQSAVAAKPRQGVVGFLAGGLVWFLVPFCMATTMGLAYTALSVQQGQPVLTQTQVDEGLIVPAVAHRLLGRSGLILVLVKVLIAITSTGSAEIMAVTSILVYDIYAVYIKPYQVCVTPNMCVLCGRGQGPLSTSDDQCECLVMSFCSACKRDDKRRKTAPTAEYTCAVHGPYRIYLDYLTDRKNWCLIMTCVVIVPFTILLNLLEINVHWVFYLSGVLVGSCVPAMVLCLFWERLSAEGMIAGSVGGSFVGLVTLLVHAAIDPSGMGGFFKNTGDSMLVANATSVCVGAVLTVGVSMATKGNPDPETAFEIWEETRNIDNPLMPWTETYARELKLKGLHKLNYRPSLHDMTTLFRGARSIAYYGSISLSIIIIIIWPSSMISAGVLSLPSFKEWVTFSEVWAFTATLFVIIVPLLSEGFTVCIEIQTRRRRSAEIQLGSLMDVPSRHFSVLEVNDESDVQEVTSALSMNDT